jgi:hypothetical protein
LPLIECNQSLARKTNARESIPPDTPTTITGLLSYGPKDSMELTKFL